MRASAGTGHGKIFPTSEPFGGMRGRAAARGGEGGPGGGYASQTRAA